jgi:hypothetical protein
MKRAYRALLRLYPYDFRAAFEAEMLAAFDAGARQARARELAGRVRGLAAEWFAKWTTHPIDRGRRQIAHLLLDRRVADRDDRIHRPTHVIEQRSDLVHQLELRAAVCHRVRGVRIEHDFQLRVVDLLAARHFHGTLGIGGALATRLFLARFLAATSDPLTLSGAAILLLLTYSKRHSGEARHTNRPCPGTS